MDFLIFNFMVYWTEQVKKTAKTFQINNRL